MLKHILTRATAAGTRSLAPRSLQTVAASPAQSHLAKAVRFYSVGRPDEQRASTVFVGNVPYELDESLLASTMEKYGTVRSIDLLTDRDSGQFTGTCFVKFDSPDSAQTALELDGSDFMGRELKVRPVTPRPQRAERPPQSPDERPPGCTSVFLSNLPYTADEAAIREQFQQFGEVAEVRIMMKGSQSTGRAFVTFQMNDNISESLDKAVQTSRQLEVGGRRITVLYALKPSPIFSRDDAQNKGAEMQY